jgi:hypothetical protein
MHIRTLQCGLRSGWFETTYHWSSWAYNTSHADKHVARAWISFRWYLSRYSRCPQWSVRTCMKIFLSYSVHCWKHKFHKAFRYLNISMYCCIPLARTLCVYTQGGGPKIPGIGNKLFKIVVQLWNLILLKAPPRDWMQRFQRLPTAGNVV